MSNTNTWSNCVAGACAAALVVGGAILIADKYGALGFDRMHSHKFVMEEFEDTGEGVSISFPGGETEVVMVGGNVIENKKVELIPVMRPQQNMHDVVKQMILLEAHMFDPERNCSDCERKHFLTIQALLEEAHSLVTDDDDPRKKLPVPTNIQALEKAVRRLHVKWEDSDRSPRVRHGIACAIRRIRKPLMKVYSRPLCN
jgi:hypothetical protein